MLGERNDSAVPAIYTDLAEPISAAVQSGPTSAADDAAIPAARQRHREGKRARQRDAIPAAAKQHQPRTVRQQIDELEHREASYKLCQRLSWLYTVRDHLREKIYPPDGKAALKSALSGSEFLDAANGKPYEDVMKVIDEHLETIKLLYPKTFSALLDKIRQL